MLSRFAPYSAFSYLQANYLQIVTHKLQWKIESITETGENHGGAINWYLEVLKKYAVFYGRDRRTEYWMFVLFNFIIAFAISIVEGLLGSSGIIGLLYVPAVFIPSLAVSVRRLHDTGRSGLWLLIAFVPLIGFIVLLVFMVQDSEYGQNQYGPNPKEAVI